MARVCSTFLFALLGGAAPANPQESGTTPEGAELLGTRPPEWTLSDWIGSPPLELADLRGKVVLVRWWTAPGCPHCQRTAPALRKFHEQHARQGLVVIGVYHHKSPGPLVPEEVRGHARKLGFEFPVATDREWSTLRRWWLTRERTYTSVTFLLDRTGTIRHIHPGGTCEIGSDDFRALASAVQQSLDEASSPAR